MRSEDLTEIHRALGRVEEGQKMLARKLDRAVTRDECRATSGGIRDLLTAHTSQIVEAVKNGNGGAEMRSLLKKSMGALGVALAILYVVVEKFVR